MTIIGSKKVTTSFMIERNLRDDFVSLCKLLDLNSEQRLRMQIRQIAANAQDYACPEETEKRKAAPFANGVVMSIRMPADVHDELQRVCKVRNVSSSNLLRSQIISDLREAEDAGFIDRVNEMTRARQQARGEQ